MLNTYHTHLECTASVVPAHKRAIIAQNNWLRICCQEKPISNCAHKCFGLECWKLIVLLHGDADDNNNNNHVWVLTIGCHSMIFLLNSIEIPSIQNHITMLCVQVDQAL